MAREAACTKGAGREIAPPVGITDRNTPNAHCRLQITPRFVHFSVIASDMRILGVASAVRVMIGEFLSRLLLSGFQEWLLQVRAAVGTTVFSACDRPNAASSGLSLDRLSTLCPEKQQSGRLANASLVQGVMTSGNHDQASADHWKKYTKAPSSLRSVPSHFLHDSPLSSTLQSPSNPFFFRLSS
ncbi:hypothetical protein M8818_001783 [Zalaria obscura]|uniref:Uncharacterized protein n=1 Tax=Zalaria obscura TaxID=2024903 RepID=A0ACC3SJB9_9PEZI